jgi:putative restriction endonuclease
MTPLDRTRLEKAAADCGFELTPVLEPNGALVLRSAMFPESVAVSVVADGHFALTSSRPVLLGAAEQRPVVVEGFARLYATLQKASATARTLPNRVAEKFHAAVVLMPMTTEIERLVRQRVGQSLFREALLDFWQGRCCITGLAVPELLRASHIKPWSRCESDEERLDVFNGLLLAPHIDALFDGGWISFSDDGRLLTSSALPGAARTQIGVNLDWRVSALTPAHVPYLAFHRQHEFRKL